jgi:hypothetical protein
MLFFAPFGDTVRNAVMLSILYSSLVSISAILSKYVYIIAKDGGNVKLFFAFF